MILIIALLVVLIFITLIALWQKDVIENGMKSLEDYTHKRDVQRDVRVEKIQENLNNVRLELESAFELYPRVGSLEEKVDELEEFGEYEQLILDTDKAVYDMIYNHQEELEKIKKPKKKKNVKRASKKTTKKK